MQLDVVAIGEPLYELNQQPDQRFLPGFGGDTSNVVIAAARLGARTAYVSKLGQDPFGDAIVELWHNEGVDASQVTRHPTAPTGLYLVTHDERSHHFFYYRKLSAASLLAPADIPVDLIGAAKFLHISGISQAISETARMAVAHAVAIARERKVRVCYDTNLRTRLWSIADAKATIEPTVSQAYLTKTSQEDAIALTGLTSTEAIGEYLLSLGTKIVIVTLGAEGVFVATDSGHIHIPGLRVKAVDATGAGDAFTGALLSELARDAELTAAVNFANAAAALSTLGYGAVKPLPQRAEVEAFLAANLAAYH